MSSASENAMSDLEANNYTQPYPPMSEPTPREELERNSEMFEAVMWVANSRYTGTWRKTLSDGKLYNQAAVNAEVLAVLDELEKSSYVPMTMGFGDRFYRIPTHKFDQLKQRYGGKEQE